MVALSEGDQGRYLVLTLGAKHRPSAISMRSSPPDHDSSERRRPSALALEI